MSQEKASNAPTVVVTQLGEDLAPLMRSDSNVDLGEGGTTVLEQRYNQLLRGMKDRAQDAFLLRWQGGKIPRGCEINGKKIAWTQNGIMTAEDGSMIGTYERITEFGGQSGRDQVIVVLVDKKPGVDERGNTG